MSQRHKNDTSNEVGLPSLRRCFIPASEFIPWLLLRFMQTWARSCRHGRKGRSHVIMSNALRPVLPTRLRPATGGACARAGTGSYRPLSRCPCPDCACRHSTCSGQLHIERPCAHGSRELVADYFAGSHCAGGAELDGDGPERHAYSAAAGRSSAAGEPNK